MLLQVKTMITLTGSKCHPIKVYQSGWITALKSQHLRYSNNISDHQNGSIIQPTPGTAYTEIRNEKIQQPPSFSSLVPTNSTNTTPLGHQNSLKSNTGQGTLSLV